MDLRKSPVPSFERAHESFDPREMSESLLQRGQASLLKDNLAQALEYFDSASKLDEQNAKIFYAQGRALFHYATFQGREKALLLASKKFKRATSLDPSHFDAWLSWGSTLLALGESSGELHYFQLARTHLKTALALSEEAPKETLAKLYCDLGLAALRIGERSEEALDLNEAIEAFQKASTNQETLPTEIWVAFGQSLEQFGASVNEIRFLHKAISCYREALKWPLLANALCTLFSITGDEDHFAQANECFESATLTQPDESEHWVNWAKFLLSATRRKPDEARLKACIEKCMKAHTLDPELSSALGIWAEALAWLGNETENAELIFESQTKLNSALDLDTEDPEIWYHYGMCLNACARYFNEYDYFYQGIEKFQTGLSIDRTLHAHWHALGLNYTHLGHYEADTTNLILAIRFFQKAIDLYPSSTYILDQAVALSKLGDATHEETHYHQAIDLFERGLNKQRNAIFLQPEWLFHYACTLDALGDFYEEETYYLRAIEIFSHVVMIDPTFHEVHHHMGLALSHYGELAYKNEAFFRAFHHFRMSLKHDEENDTVLLDWAVALINLSQQTSIPADIEQYHREAEHKLTAAAKLGNLQAFYQLSCLYSLMDQSEKAMAFLLKADSKRSLPPLDELLTDEWLENLRSTPDFRNFMVQHEHRLG